MGKIDLSSKLSKKNTVIACVFIAIFLIAGILGAVIGHKSYINSREAKIVNYSSTSSSRFFMRSNGLGLVYKYSDNAESVNLSDVLKLSDGATFRVLAVLDGNSQPVRQTELTFDVSGGQRYFVLINVTSLGGVNSNGYVIELVKESNFREEDTMLIIPSDFVEYVSEK